MVSQRVRNTQSPPLVELGQLANQQEECISLGQGAPYYAPPDWIFEEWSQYLSSDRIHRYTSDPGLYDLRLSLSIKLHDDNHVDITPDQLIMTPGANQAFYNILLTVADAGDEVILLTPYYFNHYMACQSLNISAVTVSLNDDFTLNLSAIEQAISERTKVIVLVNPGNPTGAVHSSAEIEALLELVHSHRLLLIADETYEYFSYGHNHLPVAKLDTERTISLGSFSKTYGIPGWRLGYYFADPLIVKESLKIQDTIGICAPHPSQLLGLLLLQHRDKLIPPIVKAMKANHALTADLIEDVDWLQATPSAGAYYHFPKQLTGKNTTKLVKELIQDFGVYIVPGMGFGKQWHDYCRISVANVNEETLKEAFSRLRNYSV